MLVRKHKGSSGKYDPRGGAPFAQTHLIKSAVGVFMAGPVCVVVSRVLLGPARPPTAVSSLPPPRPCTLHDPLQSDINPHPYSKLYQGERGLSTRS